MTCPKHGARLWGWISTGRESIAMLSAVGVAVQMIESESVQPESP